MRTIAHWSNMVKQSNIVKGKDIISPVQCISEVCAAITLKLVYSFGQ